MAIGLTDRNFQLHVHSEWCLYVEYMSLVDAVFTASEFRIDKCRGRYEILLKNIKNDVTRFVSIYIIVNETYIE